MKYGVILPIWQLSVRDAETLTLRAEALGLDGVFVPDHILAPPATTQHYAAFTPRRSLKAKSCLAQATHYAGAGCGGGYAAGPGRGWPGGHESTVQIVSSSPPPPAVSVALPRRHRRG